jgi:hypothetical protein
MKREFVPKDIEWLKENYSSLKNIECCNHLKCSYSMLRKLVESIGMQYNSPRRKDGKVVIYKPKEKVPIYQDKDATGGFCQDCSFYQPGGFCKKTKKDVGALWQKKCFKGEV